MKLTNQCPKCSGTNIVRADGFTEEWIDQAALDAVKNSKKAKRIL